MYARTRRRRELKKSLQRVLNGDLSTHPKVGIILAELSKQLERLRKEKKEDGKEA